MASLQLIELSVEFVRDAGCQRSDDLLAGASDLRNKVSRHERSLSAPVFQ
jgi:hypothetical protein